MADSALRFLMLSTTLWTLLQTPEIQAQSTSVFTSSTLPLSVSPSSPFTSAFSSNSTLESVPSTAGQSSSFKTNVSSTHSISSDTVTWQASAAETIAPTSRSQLQTSSTSTPVSPSQSVTSSPTTEVFSDSRSDEDDKEKFTMTEYILIACLGSFVFVLIAIIFLVVQISRLSKSVRNLKATSNR